MSYSKTTWENGKTALNATHLNNIESGIVANEAAIADVKKIADAAAVKTTVDAALAKKLEQSALADYAKTSDLAAKSVVSVKATGTATDEVQYITVDGTEYKLAGNNDKVNYASYDSLDLNTMYDTGIYEVDACTSGPNNAEAGILKVQKLDDEKSEQEWISNSCIAFRIKKKTADYHFYITTDNGAEIEHAQGNIELEYGHQYIFRGDLDGSVKFVLPEGTTAATHATKVILNGVMIDSQKDYAIDYDVEDKKLIVELRSDTYNYLIVNDKVTETATSSTGAIHSENNLLIYGTGYLSIKSDKGHGIKGSEIVFEGIPHIYCDVAHDGIHGSHLQKVCGGVYYIANANDAFGFSDESDTNELYILGGKITVSNDVIQNCIDAPVAVGTKTIVNANIILNKNFDEDHPAFTSGINVTDTCTLSGVGASSVTTVELSSLYGSPVISGGVSLPENKVINIDTAMHSEFSMSGNFTGYKIILSNSQNKDVKCNITLGGVYFNDGLAATDTFFEYNTITKRVKFEIAEGTINYFNKTGGKIVSSTANIQLENKGDIICKCLGGTSLYAPDGYILLGNDGCRIIDSLEANSVRLGKDIEDVLDEKYSIADTAIYVENMAISNSTSSKSVADYQKKIIAPQYFNGCAILSGALTYASSPYTDVTLNAMTGTIKVTNDSGTATGEEYYNEACVYVKNCTYTKNNVLTYKAEKDCVTTFPETTDRWEYIHSVQTDFYHRSEINDLLNTMQATIDALTTRVRNLEDSGGTTGPTVTDTNITLNNVVVEAENLDLSTKAVVADTDLKLN